MSDYQVPEPIICSPFEEPAEHWHIEEGVPPRLEPGRRPSVYFPQAEGADASAAEPPSRSGSWSWFGRV